MNNIFVKSNKELKKVNTLIIVALLIALNLIFDRVTTIVLTPALHVSLKFITTAVIGMLYGPVVAMYAAGINDIIGFFVYPKGMFFPGYTLTAIVTGLIFGLTLYQKRITLFRAFLSKALVNVFCNLALNTLWTSILFGKAFIPLLMGRALKNVIMLPLEVIILYSVVLMVQKAYSRVALK